MSLGIALTACASTSGRARLGSIESSPVAPYRLPRITITADWPATVRTPTAGLPDWPQGEPGGAVGADPDGDVAGPDACAQLGLELASGEALAWISLAPSIDFHDHVMWQNFRDRIADIDLDGATNGELWTAPAQDPLCTRALASLREVVQGCQRGPLSCPNTPHLIVREQVAIGYAMFSPAAMAACNSGGAAMFAVYDAVAQETALTARATLDSRLLDLATRVGMLAPLARAAERSCRDLGSIHREVHRAREARRLAAILGSVLVHYSSALTQTRGIGWRAAKTVTGAELDALALTARGPGRLDSKDAPAVGSQLDREVWSYWVLVPDLGHESVPERMREEFLQLETR